MRPRYIVTFALVSLLAIIVGCGQGTGSLAGNTASTDTATATPPPNNPTGMTLSTGSTTGTIFSQGSTITATGSYLVDTSTSLGCFYGTTSNSPATMSLVPPSSITLNSNGTQTLTFTVPTFTTFPGTYSFSFFTESSHGNGITVGPGFSKPSNACTISITAGNQVGQANAKVSKMSTSKRAKSVTSKPSATPTHVTPEVGSAPPAKPPAESSHGN
jgi:hypothetical protein